MKSHRLIAASAAAALTFGGIVGGGIVLAQDSGTTPTPSTSEERHAKMQAHFTGYITQLAANLGIETQTLLDAIEKTNLSFLDKAVAEGKLTEEQAAEIRERIESGIMPVFGIGGFGKGDHGRGHGAGPHIMGGRVEVHRADIADIAGFLGISEDELKAALEEGRTLAELTTESGKSVDDLKALLSDDIETKLAEKVADGTITQVQADEMLARHEEMVDAIINGDMPTGGHGRMDIEKMAPSGSSFMPTMPGSRIPNIISGTLN